MSENLGIILADVSRLMRRSFDARARDIGVTRPQWRVLSALVRHEGINQGGLADVLEVEPITVCRMVDRLQDAELVERRPDPTDRRAWSLFLTEKGHGVIAQLRPLADDMFDEALDGIDPVESEQVIAVLDRIRQNLIKRPLAPMVSNG
jgi:DNA-binding MarR family transcriptional regulator